MKGKLPDEYVKETVHDLLENTLSEHVASTATVESPDPDQLLKFGKRRHFAIGLILVSLFLLLLSFVLPEKDVFFWVGCSVLLMLVGAWHWDKAKKELIVCNDPDPSSAEKSPKLTLHSFDGDAP